MSMRERERDHEKYIYLLIQMLQTWPSCVVNNTIKLFLFNLPVIRFMIVLVTYVV